MATTPPTSRNVEALVEKLRADGVAAGQAEAERLRAETAREAAEIVASARREAETLRDTARQDAEKHRAAGEEALKIAMRDAIMTMKSDLIAQLEVDVQRMVSTVVAEPEMLRRMILELVGAARDAAGAGEGTEVIVPARALSADAAQSRPEEIQKGPLTVFALGLAQDMLKRGVVFYADETLDVGLRARVDGADLTIDLSDTAIAALLMRHLQPRFRAILEGVIR